MITRRYFTAPTFTLITCRAFFNGSLSFASYFFKQSIPSFPGHKRPVILFLLLFTFLGHVFYLFYDYLFSVIIVNKIRNILSNQIGYIV